MDFDPATSLPFFMPPLDTDELASWFCSGYPLEFCASASFDPDFVDSLCASGFIPMATEGPDDGRDLLLPKLHDFRAVVDPREVRVTRTARRESRRYTLVRDGCFRHVLETCATMHGDGWLRPALRECLVFLHETASARRSRLVSFELYEGADLAAGEIGAFVGSCYTSFTGFRLRSGAGTVQLAATGRWLEAAGAGLWDLGMPMDYKLALGACVVSRRDFITRFRTARSTPLDLDGLAFADPHDPVACRDLIDRHWTPNAS
ncbi:MAG: hypothetical protein NT080_10080 [Spirochaetes bacterium]|nr:hypothetical protein [Spirochaetota bacterium]